MEFLGIGAAAGTVTWLLCGRNTAAVIGGILAALVTGCLVYVNLPVLRVDFLNIWIIPLIGVFAGGGVAMMLSGSQDGSGIGGLAAVGAVSALLGGAYFFTTSPIFRSNDYAALLGNVEVIPFERAVERLDVSGRAVADRTVIEQHSVRLVDEVLAERRAQEMLGRDPEFGGTYRLGKLHLTRREGRLVWAGPLEYTGLMRWFNGSGTPGYVWVDAHDPRQSDLVRQIGGRPIRMQCLESAWGGSNLDRAMWSSGNQSVGLIENSFEIGPDGRPYYVATTFMNRVGFGGEDMTGVVVFDPQTCRSERHALDSVPPWVNRVVPESFAGEQATNWGTYSRGWLNSTALGSKEDIRIPTPGIELVSTTNQSTAWYIGLSTTGNPNGTTGFLLVDSRTKRATYFEQAGATESGARDTILGAVSQMRGWTATWPILYNISGRPTYMATLKDAAGNFKGVALLPVDDRNLVVWADDLRGALLKYGQALAGQGTGSGGADAAAAVLSFEGRVTRFAQEVVDGNSIYLLLLEDPRGQVFRASNRVGPQVSLTREGDRVRLRAQGDPGSPMTVLSMENDLAATAP